MKFSLALALLSLIGLVGAGCVTEKVPEPPHTYGHVKSLKEMKKKTSPPKQADTTETTVTQ